jgi:dynein heavy chain, axonemal
MRQCTGLFRFGYEYMGLNGRLVITALTDRWAAVGQGACSCRSGRLRQPFQASALAKPPSHPSVLPSRCYMTLTTALTYRLGGAPAGPAGTGEGLG